MRRWAIAVGVLVVGLAAGAFTLSVTRDGPGYWFASSAAAARAALLVGGVALIAGGMGAWLQRPGGAFGPLLAAAGFAWLLLEWNNPAVDSPLAFTAGLALYASCPPLLGHAALAYPNGRVGARLDRAALAAAYLGFVALLGFLPALVFDPQAAGCSECARNLLLVDHRPGVAEDLTRGGLYLGLPSVVALAVLAGSRLARASTATRPVLAAAALYLTLVAVWVAASLDRGYLANGSLERSAWLGQALALAGLAGGLVWVRLRAHRARNAVAHLVVELAASPPPGRLREALATIVGDPDLVLAYPLGDRDGLVDADGRPVELPVGRERTTIVSEGRTVAVLGHVPRLLDDEQLVQEVTAAARLALENERLRAEAQARLDELRASRARIVAAGDAERKRLERDLHDGAQQRLVGLALSLRLAGSRLSDERPAAAARLSEAEAELRRASADLRELAHGIFPAALAEEGFAAAVEALAEEARVPLALGVLPEGRLDPAVECAAYAVVAEAARAATGLLGVRAERRNGVLVVEVDLRDGGGLDVEALEDRVGALDGRLAVAPDGDEGFTVRAELPCAS